MWAFTVVCGRCVRALSAIFCHCIVQWLGMADYMHPCITTLCDRYKHPCFACGGDFELGWWGFGKWLVKQYHLYSREQSLMFAVYVWLWWIVKIFVGEWACPSRNIIVIIKNNLIEVLCKINYNLLLILDSFKTFRKLQTLMQREGQAHSPTKSERDSAENLIDGGVGKQSLRLYGRKVW